MCPACRAPGGGWCPFAPCPWLLGSPPARPRSPWGRRMLGVWLGEGSRIPKLSLRTPNRPRQPFLPAPGGHGQPPLAPTPCFSVPCTRGAPKNHTTRPRNTDTGAPGRCPATPPPHPHLPKSLLQLQVERALLHHRLLHPPARSILPRPPRPPGSPGAPPAWGWRFPPCAPARPPPRSAPL